MEIKSMIQRKHNLIESNFEDCIMLYDIEEGKYYILNNLGSIIWGHLNEGKGTIISTIVDSISALYPQADSIEMDILQFIDILVEKGIILKSVF